MSAESTASAPLVATRAPERPAASPPRRATIVREVAFYLAVIVVVLIALFPFYWILRTSLLSDPPSARASAAPTGCSRRT